MPSALVRRPGRIPLSGDRTVLVTGASGFIGRSVVAALARRRVEIRCLVRATSDRSALALHDPEFVVGDLLDPASLRAAVSGVGAVIHLASLLKVPWRADFSTVNTEGTGHLAQACGACGGPALVVVSSLAAGGPAPGGRPRTEGDLAAPVSIYGRVKLAAENAALAYRADVPLTIVRPPMVFGPGDRATLPLFKSAAAGVHLVPGGPVRRVSLVYVEDLAELLVDAALNGERAPPDGTDDGHTGRYYAAGRETPTWGALGRRIGAAVGREAVTVLRLPRWMVWWAAGLSELSGRIRDRPVALNLDKYREGVAGSWTCDAGKAEDHLDWAPAANLDARLAATVAAYRTAGWLR